MKKVIKQVQRMEATQARPTMTMGLDMGDRFSHYCLLNEEGDVFEEGRLQSTEAAFRRHLRPWWLHRSPISRPIVIAGYSGSLPFAATV